MRKCRWWKSCECMGESRKMALRKWGNPARVIKIRKLRNNQLCAQKSAKINVSGEKYENWIKLQVLIWTNRLPLFILENYSLIFTSPPGISDKSEFEGKGPVHMSNSENFCSDSSSVPSIQLQILICLLSDSRQLRQYWNSHTRNPMKIQKQGVKRRKIKVL